MYAGSCVRFIVQSLSYVILMYIVLLIGLAFNCVIVPSLVGLVCLCSGIIVVEPRVRCDKCVA